MERFKKSPVVFNEEAHNYTLGEKRLAGITGLIHSILGLGVYPDAGEYQQDYVIPRAGSRGTAVHHAIQTYDLMGIRQYQQTVRTRYGCIERDNVSYKDEVWNVVNELESYISHMNRYGFKALANELTVSDNKKYASQIDNVWENLKTGGIWLVDTKTNNTDLYPVCGYFNPCKFSSGVEALKEYLSWQLSIYAELFELENPGMKVEGLACNWLRKDEAEFWTIERKPGKLVWELLSSDYIFTDNGTVFFHPDPSVFGIDPNVPVVKEEQTPIVPEDVVRYFSDLLRTVKDAEAKLDEAKTALRAAMAQHEVKKYDFGAFTATLSSDTTSTTFDSERFKKENPDLYKQYLKQTSRKGSLTLKLKDNKDD